MADEEIKENFDEISDEETINSNFLTCQNLELMKQGAEGRLYKGIYLGKSVIVKERFPKKYRHYSLDETLTKERMKSEIRCIFRCRLIGVKTPPLYFVDDFRNQIVMGFVDDAVTVREYVATVQKEYPDKFQEILIPLALEIGRIVATLHENHIVHGDLTTSNILIRRPFENLEIVMIDFGLSYIEQIVEDKAVDLYVLERAFISTHPNSETLFQKILDAYEFHFKKNNGGKKVLTKLAEVRLRGRKRLMIG